MYETMVLQSEALLSVPFGEGSVLALLLCYVAGVCGSALGNIVKQHAGPW